MGGPTSPGDVTRLLQAWSAGDENALEALMPLVYGDLQRRARHYMRRERPDHTLQTSALINEAYLRLAGSDPVAWENRDHFFSVAARAMRRVLVDHARARGSHKRGGDVRPVALGADELAARWPSEDLVRLDDALAALARHDPRKERVVELRYFGGLSVVETAQVLRVSIQTVHRDWRLAKVWLLRELRRGDPAGGG